MAGDGSTIAIEPRNHPHEFHVETYGPFSHTAGSGAVALGSNVNVPVGEVFDRDNAIDAVHYTVETIASVTRGARLYYATNGQTMAAAVSANQYVTSLFDFSADSSAVAATVTDCVVDRTNNWIPAGARLFLNVPTTSDTAMVGLRIRIRRRTLLR